MPNSVVVGRLRAVHPDHIVLGGSLRILLPSHLPISMDGLEVGTSLTVVVHHLTVVVHQENDHLIAESVRKTPDHLLGG